MCYNIPIDKYRGCGILISHNLKDIYIGNIDGEEEAIRGDFEQLFYTKNSKYQEIMTPGKFIISGRKGTGKTLLANYLFKKANESKNISCKILKKEDFTLQRLIDLQSRDLRESELSLFWKWSILLKLGEVIISEQKIKTIIPNSKNKKLKKFLSKKYPDDLYKLKDFNKTTSESSTLNGETKKSNSKARATIESGKQISENYGQKEYFELLNTLESLVTKCIKKHKDIILIFDDLDELEDRVNNHEFYSKLLISMLETIQSLNLVFRKLNKVNSKIIVLLRSDIIDDIHSFSSNSNKLTSEGRVNLYWIDKKHSTPAEHPLMEMILTKIETSLNLEPSLNKNSIYKMFFPKKVKNKEVIDYLLDYSFGRPRDIVRYLNLVITKYPDAKTFEPIFFKDCLQEYSKWFFNELKNEISISEHKTLITDGLKLINDFKRNTFHYNMIEQFYTANSTDYPNITNLKETLQHLYKLGVIGNSWRHGYKGNFRYSWGYREDASDESNFSKTFVIHYGFRKYFSL